MELVNRSCQKLQASQKWMTALQALKQLLSTDSSEAANMMCWRSETRLKLNIYHREQITSQVWISFSGLLNRTLVEYVHNILRNESQMF